MKDIFVVGFPVRKDDLWGDICRVRHWELWLLEGCHLKWNWLDSQEICYTFMVSVPYTEGSVQWVRIYARVADADAVLVRLYFPDWVISEIVG